MPLFYQAKQLMIRLTLKEGIWTDGDSKMDLFLLLLLFVIVGKICTKYDIDINDIAITNRSLLLEEIYEKFYLKKICSTLWV